MNGSWRYHLWLCMLLLAVQGGELVSPLSAQEAAPAASISSTEEQDRYQKFYLPENDFGRLLTIRPGVLLEVKQFEELVTQARAAEQSSVQPSGILVESLHYDVRLAGDEMNISARCQLTKLSAGWAVLTLPFDQVFLKQALLNGKPAPLGRSENGNDLILLTDFTGQQELSLQLTTPLRRAGTDELASFSLFPDTAATLSIEMPAGRVLQLNGTSTQTESETAQVRTQTLSVGGWKSLQLRLFDSINQSREESVVFAHTEYLARVERNNVSWQATCFVDLFGQRFRQLKFHVPRNLEMTNVQAPGLRAWELQDDPAQPDRTRVLLDFRDQLPERLQIQLTGVQLLANPEDWKLADLQMPGATTHTGRVQLIPSEQIRLKTMLLQGVRPAIIEKQATAKSGDQQPQFFEIWDQNFTLQLAIAEREREVQAAVSHVLNIEEQEVRLNSVITLQTFFSPLFEFSLSMPAQWAPEQIRQQAGDIDWQFTSRQAGEHQLLIPVNPPLKPGEKRSFWVTTRLNRESATFSLEPQEFPLPALKLAGVSILEGTYVITASPLLEVVPVQVSGMDPVYLGLQNERFGYRYQDSIIAGSIQVTRKPPRFNARTTQLVSVDETQLRLSFQTELDISGGGLREVTLQLSPLPEVLGEFQSLSSVNITQQQQEKTETGLKWKLTFDRFVTGKIPLKLDLFLPRQETESLSLPEMSLPCADLQEQFLVLSAEDSQLLSLELTDAAGQHIPPIDPADLPPLTPQVRHRIVTGYHLTQPGLQAQLKVSRFSPAAIPSAIGKELTLRTLLPASGQQQQQAVLLFVSSGVQSLQVELPDQAKFWSATLNQIPVTARQGENSILIPLDNSRPQGELQQLQLIYGLEPQSTGMHSLAAHALPAPRFMANNGHGGKLPVQILQTDWLLYHAPQTRIETVSAGLENVTGPPAGDWVSALLNYIEGLSVWDFLGSLLVGGIAYGTLLFLVRVIPSWTLPMRIFSLALLFLIGLPLLFLSLLPEVRKSRSVEDFAIMQPAPAPEAAPAFDANHNGLVILEDETQINLGVDKRAIQEQQERRMLERKSHSNQLHALPEQNVGGLPMDIPMPPARNENIPADKSELSGNPFGTVESSKSSPETAAKKSEGGAAAQKDGLLSLSLAIQVPEQMEFTQLRTIGSLAPEELEVRYLSQLTLARLRWLIVAIVVLLFWMLRDSSPRTRWVFLLTLLGLPLLSLGMLPEMLLPLAEGLFLGGICGLAIWLLIIICRSLGHLWNHFAASSTVLKTAAPLLAIACLQLFTQTAQAQPAQSTPAVQLLPAPVKPAPPQQAEKIPLILPFDPAKSPLSAERVFVPQLEYMRLWNLAHPQTESSPPNATTQIHEATYLAEYLPAANSSQSPAIQLRARFVVQNFQKSPQFVTLPLSGPIAESLTSNGQPISATATSEGSQKILLSERGVQIIDALFRLPAEVFGTAGQFTVKLAAVPAGSFAFRLPAEQVQILFNEGKRPFQQITRNDQLYAELALGPAETLQVEWQPRQASRQLQFLSCESVREVFLQAQGAQLQYVFNLQIAQGSFSEVELQTPAGVKLKSISGVDVAGWQITPERSLRILFKKPIEKQTRITIALFAPYTGTDQQQSFVLPDLVPAGVTREMGTWGLHWESSLNVRMEKTEGVRQLQASQWKSTAETSLFDVPQRVYRFTSRPQILQLGISEQQTRVSATHYTGIDIQLHKTHVTTLATIEISGQLLPSLEFKLPKDLQIVDLTATDLKDWFVTSPAGDRDRLLTVLFLKPQQGQVQINVQGHIQQSALESPQPLLEGIQLANTDQNTTYLGIGATEILGISLQDVAGWQIIAAENAPDSMKTSIAFPLRTVLLTHQTSPQPVQISLHRQQAQLKAHSICLMAVSPASIDYGLSLQWTVSSAAADRFQFVGPSWLVERIEFDTPGIRQIQTHSLAGEKTLWTIQSQRPQAGTFLVSAVVTVPLPADRQVSVPELQFVTSPSESSETENTSTPLEIQGHYAVLVNLGQEPLEAVSDHTGYFVNQTELPIRLPQHLVQQAMEILRITPAVLPRWEIKRLEHQESPPAAIPLAELTTVLDGAGFWRMQAVYQVKNRQRQFLPVKLPPQSLLLSTLVNHQPARPFQQKIAGENILLIPLPTSGAADLSVPVQLILEGELQQPLLSSWAWSRLALPSPNILTPEASAEFGIPVLHTLWEVRYPDNYNLRPIFGTETNLNPVTSREAERLSWENRLQELSSLSLIISQSSQSYEQRQRAADNLKRLQQSLSETEDESLQQKQTEVLEQAEKSLQKLKSDSQSPASPAQQQSLGRSYILQNNLKIREENKLSEKPSGPSSTQRKGSTTPSDSYQITNPQAGTAITPDDLKSKRMPSRPAVESRDSENRRHLLEENLRQNSLFYSNQAPAAPQAKQQSEPQNALGMTLQETTPQSAQPAAASPEAVLADRAATGGLSLQIELPQHGQSLRFSKVGGNPELQLHVHSSDLWQTIAGWLWTLCGAVLLLWLLLHLPRLLAGEYRLFVASLLLTAGMAGFMLLPGLPAWLALLLGGLTGCYLLSKPSPANT